MRITFIQPNMGDYRAADAMEPLVWSGLKALTPPDIDVEFFDDRIEKLPDCIDTDVAAISVETYTASRSYKIAESFRKRDIPVIMGGFHPTVLPEEVAKHADAVVTGDAEELWPRIIEDLRSGDLQKFYHMEQLPDISQGVTDRSIYPPKRYRMLSLVQHSRGCRHACNFCSIRANYGSTLRFRDLGRVIDDIKASTKDHIFFVDDNLFGDREKFKELLEALIPLKITWSCQISIDVTDDEELLDLMERSGCFNVLVGFESLNPANMSQMGKKWSMRSGPYSEQLARIHDRGMLIYGTFIFGYDDDGPDVFDETVQFALDSGFFLANFNPLTPMPGTVLYDKLEKEGRLVYQSWWTDPAFRYGEAAFQPAKMTANELTDGCYRSRMRFNTYGSIFKRLIGNRVNRQTMSHVQRYLMANLISRQEINKKQGARLG